METIILLRIVIDIFFRGMGVISADNSQDGFGAIDLSSSNIVTIEFKKELNSVDESGNDIQWLENNTYSLVIMWDSSGRGSGGGTASHSSRTLIGRNIFINPDVIAEFSGLFTLILIVLFSLPLIIRKIIKVVGDRDRAINLTKFYFDSDIQI